MRTSNVTYLVKKGISSVWKNLLMSFASFSILMVSLLLVGCSVLLMMNVNTIMKNIEDTNEIAIYLNEGVTQKQTEHIRSVLEKNDNISEITYRSKEEGLEDFRQKMGKFSELLDYLDENPMPETFLVRVGDITKIRQAVTEISSVEGVEKVQAPYDFASALIEIRNTFSIIAGAVLLALIIVSIVIVSNTIRTSVFARRNEISIMRYVGATSAFIKTPFFVEGMFIGILAGAAAWGAYLGRVRRGVLALLHRPHAVADARLLRAYTVQEYHVDSPCGKLRRGRAARRGGHRIQHRQVS